MLAELAASVRSGEVSPLDLVRESLRRIDESHEALNAVVARRDDAVLAEAESHPATGPLAGLPVLVKDMARCAGWRTTLGSSMYADAPVDDVDDVLVERLRAAGAIVVGRSNTPAFGHAPFTTNRLFGATRNPWNPQRSPGGSSGGSGAALAAGLVPIATTSDGGGSVRIPSSLCGLVGYKPTAGAIGRNVLPRWIEFSTQGTAGHSVADVVLEASVTHGAASGDWLSIPAGTIDLTPTRPARIVACRTLRADVDAEIGAAFEAGLAALRLDGYEVSLIDAPTGPSDAFDWFVMATAELAQSLSDVRETWDELEPSLQDQLRFGSAVTAEQYLASMRRRHELGRRIDDAIGADRVLVTPTVNCRSWGPEGPIPDCAGAVRGDPSIALSTPEFNSSGHPAVSVPIGHDDAGVPIGLQVVAPRYLDRLALGIAESLERVAPWSTVAPGYQPFGAPFGIG